MIKAKKYRFYPTKHQETLLRQTLGCCRLVYNKSLDLKSKVFNESKKSLSSFDLMKELTKWKKEEEFSFLTEVSNVCLQQSIRHLGVAFENFFSKKAKFPKFKKKSNGGSVTFTTSGFRIKHNQLFIAKSKEPLYIYELKHKKLLNTSETAKSIRIRLTPSNQWYVSIIVEDSNDYTLPKIKKSIGLDMGITSLVTDSDGNKYKSANTKSDYIKLEKLQRLASKKKLGSKNRYKANIKVARCYQRISNKRQDTLHKLSTKLVNENQVIVIEDLNVKGMISNHKLAKSIGDASWNTFKSMLDYKCKIYGRELCLIDRFFPSSKTCNKCGYIKTNLKLSERQWVCPECGEIHDRDINAAKNILVAGQVVFVCGGGIRLKDDLSSNATSYETENLKRELKRTPRL